MAKWLKQKLLGRAGAMLPWSSSKAPLHLDRAACPAQGDFLWPWGRPDLHVASKGYVLGLGLMVQSLWPYQTGSVGQDIVGLMLATSDNSDPFVILP